MSSKETPKDNKKQDEQKPKDNEESSILADFAEEEELNEEDLKIKADLDLLVERTSDPNLEVVFAAIQTLKKEIKTSTASMTSVPKPLKFLRSHYPTLKENVEKLQGTNKAELADVVSWLGMTAGYETRDCLNYKLKGTKESITIWGHEYVRHLCLEIGDEYEKRTDTNEPVDDLLALVDEIVPFLLTHNAEPDACDILLEVQRLEKLVDFVDEINYKRVLLYLETCANYLAEPEDTDTLRVSLRIAHKMKRIPETLRFALALDDKDYIKQLWDDTTDPVMKRQLAFMLGQHGYYTLIETEEDDQLKELMGNVKRTEYFKLLGKDLDILEPKTPEDIYKSEITGTKGNRTAMSESARQNLVNTFVNAFVNAGYSKDKLMTEGSEGTWIFQNKEAGRASAAASVGMICLWDPDTGANEVDKYSHLNDEYIKAGVMLGVGVVNANVKTTFDIAFTYVSDYIDDKSALVRQCTALALGLSNAGSTHESVREVLKGMYEGDSPTIELLSHIALALGFIHVGTCDADLTELFLGTFLERGEVGLKSTYSRYLCLAIGLLYLGKQEAAEVAIESLKAVPGVMGKYAALTVEVCAYAGTGNVLKIQKLLAACGEHIENNETNMHQAVAVLGIALIALREDVGRDMVVRSFDHLLQYGEVNIRRAVPLALGVLSICNPDMSIMDTLSKFSHDHDAETAMGAIFALGLIGAGTNNSRIAGMLRNLADYHQKDANISFIARLAQGILHMGKGTITLNPYHSGGLLLRPAAMAGILSVIHTCFDFKGLVLGKAHYMLYNLALAMQPRMLMTFDENLEPLQVSVRVGQAVDVIGKAGNPKAITGFQTHNTPVLLGAGDRAELATDEYISVSPFLEGCVILQPNPDAKKKKPTITTAKK